MSIYLREMAKSMFEIEVRHGWVVTRDVFSEGYPRLGSSAGVTGPRDAPEDILAALERVKDGDAPGAGFHSAVFDLYVDDDGPGQPGERMCRGRLVWTGDAVPDEDVLISPLNDIGPAWGCVRISFPGHPSWNIG